MLALACHVGRGWVVLSTLRPAVLDVLAALPVHQGQVGLPGVGALKTVPGRALLQSQSFWGQGHVAWALTGLLGGHAVPKRGRTRAVWRLQTQG